MAAYIGDMAVVEFAVFARVAGYACDAATELRALSAVIDVYSCRGGFATVGVCLTVATANGVVYLRAADGSFEASALSVTVAVGFGTVGC